MGIAQKNNAQIYEHNNLRPIHGFEILFQSIFMAILIV